MSKPAASLPHAGRPDKTKALRYGACAWAVVEVPLGEVDGLRRRLGEPANGQPFPPSFLKPADEQTVAALAAVTQAARDFGLAGRDFTHWSVVAAPRYLGRIAAAETLRRFDEGGVWKVSPLFVPHHSLHAVSGTISQALKVHGPNFGVGGGPSAVADGLLTTIALLEGQPPPGLWSVWTRCDPEPRPDPVTGELPEEPVARAIALAFVPVPEGWSGLRLRLILPSGRAGGFGPPCDKEAMFADLARFLRGAAGPSGVREWVCPLPWGGVVRLADGP